MKLNRESDIELYKNPFYKRNMSFIRSRKVITEKNTSQTENKFPPISTNESGSQSYGKLPDMNKDIFKIKLQKKSLLGFEQFKK